MKEINWIAEEIWRLWELRSRTASKVFPELKSKIAVSVRRPIHVNAATGRSHGAGGGDRTHTGNSHGILSPVCLPIPSHQRIWRGRQDSNLHILSDYWQFSKLLPYQLGLLPHIQGAYVCWISSSISF